MIKIRIVLIEDDIESRAMTTSELEECPRFIVQSFASPIEFLIKRPEYDLVISDWNFGYNTLEFFIGNMDASKLIILSGGFIASDVKCLAVVHKLNTDKLVGIIIDIFKLSRTF